MQNSKKYQTLFSLWEFFKSWLEGGYSDQSQLPEAIPIPVANPANNGENS
ncbi:hypothetical protein A33Q_1591 [Indibacter alkaliphilus LW1]|jgi:hypothetical protein|uniref:Uncharacterized protein n=1 Tax=Indibacter alkaliphilus (strain CCUG 57479 / KCTC 22604 / LW1) TaxID=1189612 RepID=S2DG66_INDAL|nr:hypothetical protein [Indibacter alkaliphilus]EOZ97939.1 hypothetical protein A33Q_1591 [Indibacter alkaliphilus LW1]